jgi:SAM-dependent methyltransferase
MISTGLSSQALPEVVEEIRNGYRWTPQVCPICEVPPKKYVGRRGGRAHRAGLGVECQIWRCAGCGLVFSNPMPVPVGGIEQHYLVEPDSYFKNHDTARKVESNRGWLAFAEILTGGKGRVLDIGTGRGELLVAARELGWEAVGIEPSASFAEHAARNSGVEVRSTPIEQCGFADDSFDVVILAAVLEHLYNPNETMSEIARVLRRGGALFVDVPNESGLYFRIGNLYQKLRGRDWSVNLAPTFPPFHVFGFNPRSLQALLEKHSLKQKYWRVFGGEAMLPAHGGAVGALERLAAHAVTAASKLGEMGTYIETWAIKV